MVAGKLYLGRKCWFRAAKAACLKSIRRRRIPYESGLHQRLLLIELVQPRL